MLEKQIDDEAWNKRSLCSRRKECEFYLIWNDCCGSEGESNSNGCLLISAQVSVHVTLVISAPTVIPVTLDDTQRFGWLLPVGSPRQAGMPAL